MGSASRPPGAGGFVQGSVLLVASFFLHRLGDWNEIIGNQHGGIERLTVFLDLQQVIAGECPCQGGRVVVVLLAGADHRHGIIGFLNAVFQYPDCPVGR